MNIQFKFSKLLMAMMAASILLGMAIRIGIPVRFIAILVGFLIIASLIAAFLKFCAPNSRDWAVASGVGVLLTFTTFWFPRTIVETTARSFSGMYTQRVCAYGYPFGFYFDKGFNEGIDSAMFAADAIATLALIALAIFLNRRLIKWSQ